MQPSWYSIRNIMIRSQNLMFVGDWPPGSIQASPSSRGATKNHETIDQTEGKFLVWAHAQNLHARMNHSDSIDLRKPKSVLLDIFSGWNHVRNGHVSLRAASAGLRLETTEAVYEYERESEKIPVGGHMAKNTTSVDTQKDHPGTIRFKEIEAGRLFSIRIPYSLEHDLNELTVKIQISYNTEAGSFTYACDCTFDIALPLSVNVQDIFKQHALFSRFTIGPVSSTPLRLHSCRVDGNSCFDVLSLSPPSTDVIVFAKQHYSLISKIGKKKSVRSGASLLSKPFQRLLHLEIEYHCLDQEIYAELEASLLEHLERHALQKFSLVLGAVLRAALRPGQVIGAKLEASCLLGQFSKGSFIDYGWGGILSGFGPNDSQKLELMLKEWHKVYRHSIRHTMYG